jgi:predicted DCC family thiol-disulfide oxidoreductase YuxK
MTQIEKTDGVVLVYDGECPLCTTAAKASRIKKEFGSLELVDARVPGDYTWLIGEITKRGYDLDEGMVIYANEYFYHGEEALIFLARHGSNKNPFSLFCKVLFSSKFVAALSYPWMRRTRNGLLKLKSVEKLNNLKEK